MNTNLIAYCLYKTPAGTPKPGTVPVHVVVSVLHTESSCFLTEEGV